MLNPALPGVWDTEHPQVPMVREQQHTYVHTHAQHVHTHSMRTASHWMFPCSSETEQAHFSVPCLLCGIECSQLPGVSLCGQTYRALVPGASLPLWLPCLLSVCSCCPPIPTTTNARPRAHIMYTHMHTHSHTHTHTHTPAGPSCAHRTEQEPLTDTHARARTHTHARVRTPHRRAAAPFGASSAPSKSPFLTPPVSCPSSPQRVTTPSHASAPHSTTQPTGGGHTGVAGGAAAVGGQGQEGLLVPRGALVVVVVLETPPHAAPLLPLLPPGCCMLPAWA